MKERAWEYEGRTVEEATQIALEELGLEREDIHVETLEESQKGFLGLGGKEARIKVELIGEWEVMSTSDAKETGELSPEEVEMEQEERAPVSNTGKPTRMVEEVLGIMEVEAMVEGKEEEEAVIIDVWGDDVAILIGKGGATLDALQYLVNVCCRRNEEVSKRITVDIEGYHERRKARIEKQAHQMASKVLEQGRGVELPPMSPSERKCVHVSLRDFDGVRTESEGEGLDRRVVIFPDEVSST